MSALTYRQIARKYAKELLHDYSANSFRRLHKTTLDAAQRYIVRAINDALESHIKDQAQRAQSGGAKP